MRSSSRAIVTERHPVTPSSDDNRETFSLIQSNTGTTEHPRVRPSRQRRYTEQAERKATAKVAKFHKRMKRHRDAATVIRGEPIEEGASLEARTVTTGWSGRSRPTDTRSAKPDELRRIRFDP